MSIDDDNDSTRSPQLQEVLERAGRGLIAEGVHCMIPARVEKYDAAKQVANVQILIKDFHRDETGALVVTSIPIINNVPVQFLAAGGFAFTVPVEVGTLGSLVFAERSMDRWEAGSGQEVDPEIYTRFNLTDAVFLPGVRAFGDPLAYVPAGKIKMGQDSSTGGRIEIDSSGNIAVIAKANSNVSVEASGTGQVNVTAQAVTGKVGLGPVASLAVLVQGAFDGMGIPVTQAPAATLTIVKAG